MHPMVATEKLGTPRSCSLPAKESAQNILKTGAGIMPTKPRRVEGEARLRRVLVETVV